MRRRAVRDVMTREVVTARVDTSFKDVARLLEEHKISAVPVLDEADRLVGIVSEADLLLKEEYSAAPPHRSLLQPKRIRLVKTKAEGAVAGEVMTTPPVTIGPDASLVEAARLIAHRKVKRLPVVDADGAMVGILSRADLVKVFLRPDGDILDEINEHIFERILLSEPGTYNVQVVNGIVTLAGRLDRKSSVEIADRLTRAVDGVVDVVNELTFRFDDSDSRVVRAARSGPGR